MSFDESVAATFFSHCASLVFLSLAEEVAEAAAGAGPLEVVEVTPNCEILEADTNSAAAVVVAETQCAKNGGKIAK